MSSVADEIGNWSATLLHLQDRIKTAEEDIVAIIDKARDLKNFKDSESDLALLMTVLVDVNDTKEESKASSSSIKKHIKANVGESSQQTFESITTEINNAKVREMVGR